MVRGVTVYDDFAHHPTAISATIAGLRQRVEELAEAIAGVDDGLTALSLRRDRMEAELAARGVRLAPPS